MRYYSRLIMLRPWLHVTVFDRAIKPKPKRESIITIMLIRGLLIALLLLSFTACSVHKIDIQQGNIVEDEQLEKLHVGMRRPQVLRLLGTPLIQDPFRPDRWDYVYYFKPANKPADLYQLILFFEGDHLVHFDTDIPQRRPSETNTGKDDEKPA